MTHYAVTRIASRALLANAVFGAFAASTLATELAVIQDTPMTGGDGSVAQFDHNAYSLPLGNLPMAGRLDFSVGNSFFRNPWVVAPASTDARDGLGPLINTNSCQGCHIKDGRGHPPAEGERAVSLFLRLSMPSPDTDDTLAEQDNTAEILRRTGALPVPHYGRQLQNAAIAGAQPEADLVIDYQPREVSLNGGETVILREPHYRIENPAYGELPSELLTSPRVAPPMIGLGLLEAITDTDILAGADPYDENGDGISGRANQVWDLRSGTTMLGRFGWKAGEPSVEQQSLHAFAGDMGLTSNLVPHTDCMPSQQCDKFTDGGTPEVSDEVADFITFYASSLAVPQRRGMDSPAVMAGAESFNALGCSSCHTPQMRTANNAKRPELANQTIWPYSDLLLHDMGEGLADGRAEYQANGNEWRTPPLWGIGLTQQVNPLAGFLHDGRARTLQEAILWHGGEASTAMERYRQLPPEQRAELITFLESL
ncbi:di-heme oxidoredictase family protein [Halomonas halocynthiae]|uniref:di-heme oxidoreductase family protein n=1 Tax=Halomonas halocynthiae TaxID=176290 RepID=UPI0004186DC9|nr:di-heme oxidoredictase family protein [Halomonas halocynthiae]